MVTAALGELHQFGAPDNNIVVAVPSPTNADALAPALLVQRRIVG
jgi:hypothetical protein